MARLSHAETQIVSAPVAPPKADRLIDLVHLARQTLGDPGLEREVLRIYSDVCGGYCEAVKSSAIAAELKISLHSLKGASAGVGANGVAQVARAAEEELRSSGKLCEETRADIAFAVEEVRAYIGDLLKD